MIVDDDEFGLSQNLKDIGHTVSYALGLQNENEGVKVVIQTQGLDIEPRESLVSDVVHIFQDRRLFLLQNLRIVLQEAASRDSDDGYQERFEGVVRRILELGTGPPSTGSAFVRKCLNSMAEIENRLSKISDELQGRQAIPAAKGSETTEILEFQKISLFKQHEALGGVLTHLFRHPYSTPHDFRELIKVPQRWKQLDFQLLHYLPCYSAAFRQYGSADHSSSLDDATSLTDVLKSQEAHGPRSALQPFHAVLSLWWTAEYSSWFRDVDEGATTARDRVDMLKKALKENALELLLSICTKLNFEAWRHPARQEILSLLLREPYNVYVEEEPASDFFSTLIMESLESFAEAWITNMPDSIRELKNEEDQQRLLHITAMQEGPDQLSSAEQSEHLYLESLLILLSFAFDNRHLAAEEAFWQDPESNLFGFLQWTSKRQTVPRVGAFCELLCSIAQNSVCAEAAHKFLLDETATAPTGRRTRNPSMSYQQIFAELELYSRKVHERQAESHIPHLRKVQGPEMNEVESPIMLSCYLRLLTHLSHQTNLTRDLLLNPSSNIPQNLLALCAGPVPSYLRGSIFGALEAMLTNKTTSISLDMWKTIDQWAATVPTSATSIPAKPDPAPALSIRNLQNTLSSMPAAFDQVDAFVGFLCALMAPCGDEEVTGSLLPFPADLGSSYRSPGITPYVDLIFRQIFRLLPELHDFTAARVLTLHCLNFIVQCLESFNEDYVALMGKTTPIVAPQTSASSLAPQVYVQVHPFARTMRWLFSSHASKILMGATAVESEDLGPGILLSPTVPALERALDILILILDLQPTYLDIVRPAVIEKDRDAASIPAAFDSFEDAISSRPSLIHDLCTYAATDNDDLVYKSLNVLERLSSSEKLNHHFIRNGNGDRDYKRVVDMLGPNAGTDLLPVTEALSSRLNFDERELEEGFESARYEIKDTILSFFAKSLSPHHNLPSVAHLLLGFTRAGERLDIFPDGQLDRGEAIFNAVVSLAQDYPDGIDDGKQSWLMHVKSLCMIILQHLWSTQISSPITISQLRRYKFLQYQFGNQEIVHRDTLWDGLPTSSETFWFGQHAEGLVGFLEYRSALYNYTATEIRVAAASSQTGRQKECLSTLLGRSTTLDGVEITHPNIYELFDFIDLDISANLWLPALKYFGGFNFETYVSEASDDHPTFYLLDGIREFLRSEIRSKTSLISNKPTPDDEAEIREEAQLVISILRARNLHLRVQYARRSALRHWVEVVEVALDHCPMDTDKKIQFILQLLQILLPKFDNFILNNLEDSFELARVADALLRSLSQLPGEHISERTTNVITDRLFQLFRISIEGITKSDSNSALRHLLYNISSQYLARITGASDASRKARSRCLDCVRSAGPSMITVISNDAEDGLDATKPASLTLLAQLASLARDGKSSFITDSLTRANTMEILIDPIKYLAAELQQSDSPVAVKYILSVFDARMLFLLEMSRTREGAAAMLDVGLLQTIRDSLLFQADPDLGIGKFTQPFLLLFPRVLVTNGIK